MIIHSVRLLIGANAYAVIKHGNNCQSDILLSPGKSAQASLREYADQCRKDAERYTEKADLAQAAADHMDKGV